MPSVRQKNGICLSYYFIGVSKETELQKNLAACKDAYKTCKKAEDSSAYVNQESCILKLRDAFFYHWLCGFIRAKLLSERVCTSLTPSLTNVFCLPYIIQKNRL